MSRMDVQISSCEHNLVHSVQSIHHSEQCLGFLHLASNSFGTLHVRTDDGQVQPGTAKYSQVRCTSALMMAELQQQRLTAVAAFSATSPGSLLTVALALAAIIVCQNIPNLSNTTFSFCLRPGCTISDTLVATVAGLAYQGSPC